MLFIQPIRATHDGTARIQGPNLAGQASAGGLRVVLDRPHSQPFTDQLVDWLERAARAAPPSMARRAMAPLARADR